MSKVYGFDCECADKKSGEIIEAALLQFAPGRDLLGTQADLICQPLEIDEAFHCRYKPTKPSTFGAMAVHHILPHELEGCPASSVFQIPGDAAYVVGHSIDFDWEAAGSPPAVKRICTHAMAQHVWPEATGYSQSALIYMLLGATPATRDKLRNAHSAKADVELSLIVLRGILEARPEITTWSALWAFSEECRIPRTCPMKRHEGVPLAELDIGFIYWCLRQDWLDPYFRTGLVRVLEKRGSGHQRREWDDDDDDEPIFDEPDTVDIGVGTMVRPDAAAVAAVEAALKPVCQKIPHCIQPAGHEGDCDEIPF